MSHDAGPIFCRVVAISHMPVCHGPAKRLIADRQIMPMLEVRLIQGHRAVQGSVRIVPAMSPPELALRELLRRLHCKRRVTPFADLLWQRSLGQRNIAACRTGRQIVFSLFAQNLSEDGPGNNGQKPVSHTSFTGLSRLD